MVNKSTSMVQITTICQPREKRKRKSNGQLPSNLQYGRQIDIPKAIWNRRPKRWPNYHFIPQLCYLCLSTILKNLSIFFTQITPMMINILQLHIILALLTPLKTWSSPWTSLFTNGSHSAVKSNKINTIPFMHTCLSLLCATKYQPSQHFDFETGHKYIIPKLIPKPQGQKITYLHFWSIP